MKYRIGIILMILCQSTVVPAADYHPGVVSKEVMKTTTTVIGQPIVYPNAVRPQVTASIVEIPPGGETGWHAHKAPLYAWLTAGALTVEYEGGRTMGFHEGEPIIESVHIPHNGRNTGVKPAKLLVFTLGDGEVPGK